MLRRSVFSLTAVSLSLLLLGVPAFALNSPLSDEAIREAYFLGRRRDESTARVLEKYKQLLRAPENGPYVASVEFLTPFALLVKAAGERVNYSAQQAEQEYRGEDGRVDITVEIQLTDSYPAVIVRPTSTRSGSPMGYTLRPSSFWKDFDVEVLVGEKSLEPTTFHGEPTYRCDEGGCVLTGASIRLELPAKLFSDAATVHVTPPEGGEVFVDFDLASLR
jgi:hypothetical protein